MVWQSMKGEEQMKELSNLGDFINAGNFSAEAKAFLIGVLCFRFRA